MALVACFVTEGFRSLHVPTTTGEGELLLQSHDDSLARKIARNGTCNSDTAERRGSRERFLKDNAVGVGLGLATGLWHDPQPGNALFGERGGSFQDHRSRVCLQLPRLQHKCTCIRVLRPCSVLGPKHSDVPRICVLRWVHLAVAHL